MTSAMSGIRVSRIAGNLFAGHGMHLASRDEPRLWPRNTLKTLNTRSFFPFFIFLFSVSFGVFRVLRGKRVGSLNVLSNSGRSGDDNRGENGAGRCSSLTTPGPAAYIRA